MREAERRLSFIRPICPSRKVGEVVKCFTAIPLLLVGPLRDTRRPSLRFMHHEYRVTDRATDTIVYHPSHPICPIGPLYHSSSKPASKAKPTSEAKEKKPASAAKDKPTSKAKKPATASKATEKTAVSPILPRSGRILTTDPRDTVDETQY